MILYKCIKSNPQFNKNKTIQFESKEISEKLIGLK